MNTPDYKKFYAEIGKLLYAVADVDQVLTPAEKKQIFNLVRETLVPAEQHVDAAGTDMAYYAEFEADVLDEAIADGETALQSFLDYVNEHRHLVTPEMREACYLVAVKLANAYYHTNKKELKLLAELKRKLEI